MSGETNWDRWQTWELVSPPSRPSARHLAFCKRHLLSIDRDRPVAVLGSTIEYRILLGRLGFKSVYVIDKSADFKGRSDQFLPKEFLHREQFVHANWIDALDRQRSQFACILSDLTIGNLEFQVQPDYLEIISTALSPGGLFVDKWLHMGGKRYTIDSIDRRYAISSVDVASANDFNCRAVFTSELVDNLGRVDARAIYAALSDCLKSHGARMIMTLCAEIVTPPAGIWYYGPASRTTAIAYAKLFRSEAKAVEPKGSPYYSNASMVVSKPARRSMK